MLSLASTLKHCGKKKKKIGQGQKIESAERIQWQCLDEMTYKENKMMNVCVRVQVKHADGTSTLWSPSRTVLNNWDPWTAAGIGRLTLSETVFERISRVKEHQHEHQISLCSTTTLYCSPDQCYLLYLSVVYWKMDHLARIFPIEKKNTLTRPWQSRVLKWRHDWRRQFFTSPIDGFLKHILQMSGSLSTLCDSPREMTLETLYYPTHIHAEPEHWQHAHAYIQQTRSCLRIH